MEKNNIYQDISARTGGEIYLGVVGPVRSGKSTFIKRFLELMVLPEIADEHERQRTMDEMPQSGTGKTVMTTEPKFIPKEAVELPVYNAGSSGPFLFPEAKEIFPRRILQVVFSMQPQLRQKRIRYRNDTCDVIFFMKYADLPRLKIYIPKFQFLCLCFPQATAVIQKHQDTERIILITGRLYA